MKAIDSNNLLNRLPTHTNSSNKYDFGHVVIFAGNLGYGGAAILSAEAALRAGAGLVSVITRKENVSAIITHRPEIMARGVGTSEEDSATIKSLIEKADSIVLGPGLGRDEWSKFIWDEVKDSVKPKIVDADALWILSQHPQKLENAIITPHEGETNRLLNGEQLERANEVEKLLKFCEVSVLKGHQTLIACDNIIYQNDTGNPILATAGTGDILAGIIGTFLAQGLNLKEAACLGVWVHGRAADLLAKDKCAGRGTIASDLFPYIQEIVK